MQKTHEWRCTIVNFIWNSWTPLYQFRAFWWMFFIAIASGQPWQANGIGFETWIALQRCFQNWDFWEKVWVCARVFWASAWSFSLGFDSILMQEWIRLRNLIQIFELMVYEIWFSIIFFSIFFMQFCTNHDPINPNLSILNYARIIE